MKEGTSVREHVLDMMMHFNIVEVNRGAINEANQVSFILESLPKSFISFQTNASLNKIEFNLTTLLNELQRFQNLTKGKGKEVEANVATTKGKFKRGLSSKSKAGPSKSNRKIDKKEKGKTPKQNKGKKIAEKGKCYHCGENGHWLRNCPKHLAQKKAEKEAQVGTGEMVSAQAVGDLKLFFNDRYILLKNVWIGRLVKSGLLSQLEDNSLPPCDSCLEGKMTKRSFTEKGLRAKTPLELVHSDLGGPMNVKARRGYKYFISFVDDYLRYDHVYLIQNEYDSFEKFKEYKAKVENESEHGIQSQLSAPSTPQQNGVSERRNRTLLDMVRSMLSFAQLSDSFLGYALETTIYILNNVPSKSFSERPHELWKGRKGSLHHFRIWGCLAHVLVQNPKKLEHHSKLCLFVGYPKESKGGLFYDPQENKVFVSTNATFLEEDHIRNHQTRSKLVLEEISMTSTDRPSLCTKVVDKTRNIGQTHHSQELREPRRSGRVVRQPDRYLDLSEAQIIIPNDGIEDPLTYKQAMNDVDCDQWIKAMDLQMESIYCNSVWTRVDQPNDIKPIGFKWIYKRKRDQAGKVQTFKARLVAEGNEVGHLNDIKEWLATQFQMKDLGNAQYVLGIQIVRNQKNKTLAMSQTSYIDKMLSRYKMQNSKKGLLPYIYGIHLSKEQCPKTPHEVEDMSNIPYAFAVGSLMYAMLCTRPDICYSVKIFSRYQSNPRRDHWTTVKNILKYLRRTKNYMLVYGSKDLILTGYTDFDFQTDKDARKSTLGSVFTLSGGAVVWRSIKQSCIADSTMEAEYVASCEATKEAV
ncbi:gag/pol protein [Cucumis melo var. makuwa]|uniref:Gag/pol protein n=1 Tax=Cucumis melo var. makuwa TaxID=1194695 RepID=A0A5D3DFR5_CUCMM|nr:gag/pol protein [Cucumis melo var. makuwa]TYK22541.1 gag/pol protein [Cucumis melo var. makuwa]